MTEDQENKIEKPKTALIKHKKTPSETVEHDSKNDSSAEGRKKIVVVKKKVVVVKKSDKISSENDSKTDTHIKTDASDQKPVKEDKKPQIKSDTDKSAKDDNAVKRPVIHKKEIPASAEGQRDSQAGAYNSQRDSQRPAYNSQRPAYNSQRPAYNSQRPAYNSQRPAYNSQRPAYNSQRPAGEQGGSGGSQTRPPYPQTRQPYRPGPGQGSTGTQGSQQRPGGSPGYRGRYPNDSARPGQPPQGGPRTFGQRPPSRFPDKDRFSKPSAGPGKDDSNSDSSASKTASKKFFKAKKKPVYQKNKKDQIVEKNFNFKKKTIQKVNPVPKEIDIMEVITVAELARKMNLKASDVISRFMAMGMMVTINQQIDAETAEIVASEYDCKVNIVSLYDETIVECDKGNDEDIMERPPIVTVMGHVDHGKTKLLDAIRSTDIVASEHGGITQHIGAYKVTLPNKRSIVFLDTPGHEAFTLMRARGAQVTDIVVLVVAANDGVMPQTIEAINHAKEAKVPIIVAINKIDVHEANPEKVKQQLAGYNLIPEDWGGNTIFCEISALKKTGIENLLENILLQADVLELKSNPNCRAEGKIIESKVDLGRGIVSTVLIVRGTLNVGDSFIAGVFAGKVRAIFNDKGEKIDTAPPSTPVEILGFTGLSNSGDPFQVTETDKTARQIGVKRQELEKIGAAKNVKKVTLDNLYDSIHDGEIQELKVIIKGDVHGSVEALKTALEKLSTSEIKLNVIHSSAGAIVENDVNLASASNALIIGFHVRPTSKAQTLAEQEKVEIKKYNIIYDAVEDIKTAMEGLLTPDLKEEALGTVEVRDVFKVPKIGTIAGCYVQSGKVKRGSTVHLFRDGLELFSGKISSLKRFKDDAKEVEKNYECGIGLEGFNDFQAGDIIEVYEIKEISKKLDG